MLGAHSDLYPLPSKDKTLKQYWFKVGLLPATLVQYCFNASCYWAGNINLNMHLESVVRIKLHVPCRLILRVPARKVGDRGFELRSGIQVSKGQKKCFFPAHS